MRTHPLEQRKSWKYFIIKPVNISGILLYTSLSDYLIQTLIGVLTEKV